MAPCECRGFPPWKLGTVSKWCLYFYVFIFSWNIKTYVKKETWIFHFSLIQFSLSREISFEREKILACLFSARWKLYDSSQRIIVAEPDSDLSNTADTPQQNIACRKSSSEIHLLRYIFTEVELYLPLHVQLSNCQQFSLPVLLPERFSVPPL